MIKKLLFILFAFFAISVANAKNDVNTVSLESYEQGWLDNEGTLSLKNNTNEEIHNVVFVIKYLDMNGKQLDYKEYLREVNIAPGLCRKVNIPAYEYDRNYSYYKSEASFSNPQKFKIEYELRGYNVEDDEIDSVVIDEDFGGTDDYNNMEAMVVIVVLVLFVIGITIGMYVLVAVMAQHRNRSAVIWLLLSFIATPLLIVIILLCIGKAQSDEY